MVTIEIDLSRALRKLDVAKAQIPFAASVALNKTANVVKKDLQALEESQFHNLRKYTKNSLAVERSSKTNLNAKLYIRSPSVERALRVEVSGGQRDRGVEKVLSGIVPNGMFAVPTENAKHGSDGKVSLAWLKRLMSKLDASSNQSVKPTIRKRKSISNLGFFFLTQRRGTLTPGIYERVANHHVKPLILFVTHARYAPRLSQWFRVAEDSARRNFPVEFQAAVKVAMATAR